jgi:peptidoglycan/LPS O-acetylase OafA/YrhL
VEKEKNLSLHGLRGLASILVVFYHIYGMAYIGGFFEKRKEEGFFYFISNIGPMGVNIFFMISGLLIVGSLDRHSNIKKFFINRVLRIYPVFVCLHITLFILGPLVNYEGLGDFSIGEYIVNFLSNLFLLPGIFDLPIAQKNAWSLSYEFTFYLISSMFFYVSIKFDNSPYKWILISILSALSLFVVYEHQTAVFFILGVLVYYANKKTDYSLSINSKSSSIDIVLFFLVIGLYNGNNNLNALHLFLSIILFWLLVNGKGILSKVLKLSVFQYLGTISYSLYLIHPFALFPFKIIFSMDKVKLTLGNEFISLALFGLVSLATSIVASHFSYNLIERWFTNKIKTFIFKPKLNHSSNKKVS